LPQFFFGCIAFHKKAKKRLLKILIFVSGNLADSILGNYFAIPTLLSGCEIQVCS